MKTGAKLKPGDHAGWIMGYANNAWNPCVVLEVDSDSVKVKTRNVFGKVIIVTLPVNKVGTKSLMWLDRDLYVLLGNTKEGEFCFINGR